MIVFMDHAVVELHLHGAYYHMWLDASVLVHISIVSAHTDNVHALPQSQYMCTRHNVYTCRQHEYSVTT